MLVRRLFFLGCASAGFLGFAALMHRILPPRVPEVTPKLAYLAAHVADFDTVFIGSSRIYHGVSPRTFDAAMAAAGTETHSFNLGIDGMMPPESLHMAEVVMGMGLPKLRRVFVEIEPATNIPEVQGATVRDIYWRDLNGLAYGMERTREDYRTSARKYRWDKLWKDLSANATFFTRYELNIGRLIPGDTPGWTTGSTGEAWLGPDRNGYLPEDRPLTEFERNKLMNGIKAVREMKTNPPPVDALNEQDFAKLQDQFQNRGIDFTLITTPVAAHDYVGRQDVPPGAKLLAFDDPDLHPELYDPSHRVDSGHLNTAGSLIFTRELAAAYLNQFSKTGGVQPGQ